MRQLFVMGGVDHALVGCEGRWYIVDRGAELTTTGYPLIGEVAPTQVGDVRQGPWCTQFTLAGEHYWVYRGFREDLRPFLDGS